MMLLAARGDDAVSGDVVDAGRGDAGRCGREAIQFRQRRDDGFAERLDEPAGDGGGRLHRHLLAEDRAHAHLESVEGAGHSQAGVRLDRRLPGARPCCRCFAIRSGRASRSKSARTRLSSAGSTGVRLCVNSTISACFFLDCVTLIQPFASPSCTVRAYELSVTCSMPVERTGRQKREDAVPVVRRTIRELQVHGFTRQRRTTGR